MIISKQLMGWGTALRRKYSNDIFFSTRVKITLCLAVCVGIIAVMFYFVFDYTRKILMDGMIESLLLVLSTGVSDPQILASASRNVETITTATVALVLLFGLLVGLLLTRLALVPVGQAFTMQKRFISGIAHELRTPLSLLRVNNELARYTVREGTEHAALFEENIADIDRINEMLNNLLLFDRMTSAPALRFEEVNLNFVLTTICARLLPLARQKHITLTLPEATIPSVAGNATALEQVFFNVLKNAIMYTKPGGEVTFEYRGATTHDMAVVALSDTGVGIPEKDLARIFEPFYRTEKTGKLSGTGIGLAIVYEIIKMHRGTIQVESVEGTGTTFIISLPRAQNEQVRRNLLATSVSKVFFNFSDNART